MPALKTTRLKKNTLPSTVFLLIIIGYPIAAGLSICFEIESNLISIFYRAVVLLGAGILIVSRCSTRTLRVNYKVLIGASFFIYYTLRLFLEWLLNPGGSKIDWNDFWTFLLLVCLVPALPFLCKKSIPDENFAPSAGMVIGIAGLVLNFYSILQNSMMPAQDLLFAGRLESDRLNPIAYGHLAATTALLGIWTVLINRKLSILAFIATIVGILGIIASGSRGPVLSFMVCIIVILIRSNFRSTRLFMSTVVFFMAYLVYLILAFDGNSIYIFERIGDSMFSDSARSEIYTGAYYSFLDNMLFGTGYPFETYPHNIILEAFMASGLLGGLLITATLATGLMAAVKNLKDNRLSWISILFIQYLLFSMVSSSIYYSNILWMLWACVVAARGREVISMSENNASVHVK